MKKILFTLLVIMPTFLFAQTDTFAGAPSKYKYIPGTTDAEFNYVSNGYIDVITKGLDPKRGYIVNGVMHGKDQAGVFNKHRVEISVLLKEDTKQMRATMIVLYINGTINRVLCLPLITSDQSLFDQYNNQLASLSDFDKGVVLESLSIAYSRAVNAIEILENKKPDK